MQIHGKGYTEVKDRIKEFLSKFPKGKITTSVIWKSDNCHAIVFLSAVYPNHENPEYFFTGHAYEERSNQESQVNSDAWVENCETSAIGRALANMDIGVGVTRPSAEEMKKVHKNKTPIESIEDGSQKLLNAAVKKIATATNADLDKILATAQTYLGESKLTQKDFDTINNEVQSHYIP